MLYSSIFHCCWRFTSMLLSGVPVLFYYFPQRKVNHLWRVKQDTCFSGIPAMYLHVTFYSKHHQTQANQSRSFLFLPTTSFDLFCEAPPRRTV